MTMRFAILHGFTSGLLAATAAAIVGYGTRSVVAIVATASVVVVVGFADFVRREIRGARA